MANAERAKRRGFGARVFGLINPIRDPSLLVAIVFLILKEGGSGDPPYLWAGWFLLIWMAVKGFVWLLVNFAFSFVYLSRKALWTLRHPRLAWRLLDAMGTEEIIIGGLRPDMFANEDGSLHPGQPALAMGLPGAMPGMLPGAGYGGPGYGGYGEDDGGYGDYDAYGREPAISRRMDERTDEMQQWLTAYSRLISDWMGFTEEKWRAVSDSQLGWKPLNGRWKDWEEIYSDSFGEDGQGGNDATWRRYSNAKDKSSAASAVACFLHDLDLLRQNLIAMEGGERATNSRAGGFNTQQPLGQRTGKSSIIRNPMIVDAD
jgi:hypothetical protein